MGGTNTLAESVVTNADYVKRVMSISVASALNHFTSTIRAAALKQILGTCVAPAQMDAINDKFAEARDEIDYANEVRMLCLFRFAEFISLLQLRVCY